MKRESNLIKTTNQIQPVPLAIIGIGCIFPKAHNLSEYWANIREGVDAITEVPPTHWNIKDYFDSDPKKPDHTYAPRGGFLPDIEFNPMEFGIVPHALEATDTSQLLGLVAAQEALKDAGYTQNREFDRSRVSVILGVTGTLELVIPLGARLGHPIWRQALKEAGLDETVTEDVIERIRQGYVEWQEGSFPGLLGNVVAGRIANRFDFGGTNCVVDAACASSLSAIHLAGLELASGKADMVLTGGADTFNHIFMYMCFSKTPALSPSGHARPFDHQSDGTTLGEGIGIIVLKRLEDARRDGDKIYAVIKSIGSSSDGKGNAIYAPSAEGQARALRLAYNQAGLTPDTIELMEAHGTGTRVGDATEIKSMTEIYQAAQKNGAWCALGSVKSQIGHTKSAAGIAGLIKTAMALHHKVLPPTIKVEKPASPLESGETPFYVNTEKRPWLSSTEHPRRAAVSAFGFGGSNFHCILEEAEMEKEHIDWSGNVQILPFSAETPGELITAVDSFEPDMAWHTLRSRAAQLRRDFDSKRPHRLLLVVEKDKADLTKMRSNAEKMLSAQKDKTSWSTPDGIYYGRGTVPGKLGIIFPGQGSQYVGMLRDLACQFPQFQRVLAMANHVFQKNRGASASRRLSDLIYPHPTFSEEARQKNEMALQTTQIAQPAIGAVSLGVLKVLEYFDIQPDYAAGHSYGELVALCAAGVLDAETFFKLSKRRGQLMGQKKGDKGSMLAVQANVETITGIIKEEQIDLVIANKNSPQQTVLSGATAEIERARDVFKSRQFRCKQLPVAAAFHSRFVADASGAFLKALRKVAVYPPKLPVFADSTAELYPDDVARIREILSEQLVNPVEFIRIVENMYSNGIRTFLEVGPSSQISGLVKAILDGKHFEVFAVDASSGQRSGEIDLARVLAQLAASGYNLQLSVWDNSVPLHDESATSKKRAMTIPISGANYVKPRPLKPPVTTQKISPAAPAAQSKETNFTTEKPRSPLSETSEHPPQKEDRLSAQQEIINNEAIDIAAILQMTQENLRTLQQFQEQTADLHRQFLEGQDAARQTFDRLLEQQQQLLQGLPLASSNVPHASPLANPPLTPPRRGIVPQASPLAKDVPLTGTQSVDSQHIEKVLLSVVAEKTGYPAEMLELEMGLDADLGIDSIKRVEILSVLQERLSNIREIGSEHIGSIQTLGQIVELLSANGGPAHTVSNTPARPSKESAGMDTRQIETVLLDVVAEKTGYPADMLELEMGLDADLGIDSIKRVEILSALRERLPDVPEIGSEHIGSIQTLGQIVEFLCQTPPVVSDAPRSTVNVSNTVTKPVAVTLEPEVQSLDRSIIVPIKAPEPNQRQQITLPAGAAIWITDDTTPLTAALEAGLQNHGLQAKRISLNELSKLSSPNTLGGLVILAPPSDKINNDFLKNAFKILQLAGTGLRNAGRQGETVLITVSRLDGAFGFGDLNPQISPVSGGLAGLSKTAGQEWQEVHSKAIDLAADYDDIDSAAAAIIEEMFSSGPVEVGISADGRKMLQLQQMPLENVSTSPVFGTHDVIAITGGARGVTAECAFALAHTCQPALILLGRSPAPAPEPEWLSGLTREDEIKKAILSQATEKMSPKAVEQKYRAIMANREIQRTIARIEAAGARVRYYSVDVRNASAVQTVTDDVQHRFGTITGLIHGAGVLADRRIEDKTKEQFDQVYDTKVEGLNALLNALASNPLKAIVLFSSTTARLGRVGQVDYAIANEVLNKIAQQQARLRPSLRLRSGRACRVVSINWGPWDGGMVTPSLKKVFEQEGIGLIPLQAGADYLIQELSGQNTANEVVVLNGRLEPERKPVVNAAPVSHSSSLPVAFERKLDIGQHPFLKSHVIDGQAVLPAAISIEWMAHSALHSNPGLRFHGFNNFRILKGVTVPGDSSHTIQMLAGKPRKEGEFYVVPVEMQGLDYAGRKMLHAQAECLLIDQLPQEQPSITELALDFCQYKNGDIYRKYLFHGPDFHGIKQVEGCSASGIIAMIKAAPHPSAWIKQPLRNHWLTDPLIIDSCFQLLILWSFEQYQAASLPTSVGRYRQYQPKFPSHGGRVVAQIIKSSQQQALANIEILDHNGALVARIENYECVIDPSLNEAFRRNTLTVKQQGAQQ